MRTCIYKVDVCVCVHSCAQNNIHAVYVCAFACVCAPVSDESCGCNAYVLCGFQAQGSYMHILEVHATCFSTVMAGHTIHMHVHMYVDVRTGQG
jgi:hypothetical protein